ncbi:hypothetical protein QOT17_014777 [Balamuthia mandrillaris]
MEVDKGLNELQPSSQNGGRASPPALVSPQPQFMQHRPPPTGIMLPQHMRGSPSPPLQSGGSGGPGSPFLVGGGGGYMSPPHLPQHHPMHHPQHHLPMHHPVMAFHPHPHSQSPRPLPLYTASSPSPVATAASTSGGSGPQTLEALLKQQLGLTSSPSSSVEETTTGYRGVPPPEQPSTDGNSSFSSSSFSSNNHNDSENKDTPTPPTSNTTETAATPTAASASPPSSVGSSTPGTPSTMEAKTPSSRKKRSTASEPGLRLQGAVVDYASVRPKQLPQLQATQPITLYNPAQTYHLGTLIAVTKDYICYAIKGHMIRAIHIFTGETVLLRGHTQRVTDLRAFHRGNLLASVGKDGLIFVWKILQRKAETEGSKASDQVATIIDKEIVLKIEHEEGSEKQHQRVVWHPAHSNILATSASDGNVYIWDIRKLLENAENNVVVHNASTPGVIVAPVASKINDLCFSPDGGKLAIASEDGNVRIFDLETQAFVQTWNAHGGEPVHAVRWTSGPPVTASSSVAGEAFVTGGQANREIVVWNTDTWTRRQTIELEHSASDSKEASSPGQTLYFNHVAFDPSSTFLFVARAADSSVIVVHMARAAAITTEGMRGDAADTLPSNSSLEDITTASAASPLPTGLSPDAGCCYFDYLSELNVGQPILSFTATNQSLPTASPSPQEPSVSSSSQKLETKLYCMQAKAIQMYDLTARIPQLAGDAAASPMKRSKSSKRSSSRTRSLSKLSLSGKRKLAPRAPAVEPEAPPSEESGKNTDVQQEENEGASSEQEKKLQEGAASEVPTQQQAQPPAADQTTTLDHEKQPQLPPQPDEEHAKGECSSPTVDGVAETIEPKEKSEEIAATSTAEEQPESPSNTPPSAVESHKNEKSPTPKADEVSTGQSSAASVPPPRSSEALGDTQEQSASLTEVSETTTEMTSKKSPSFSILPESTKEEPSQANNNKAGPDTTHATPPPTPASPQQRPKHAEKPTTPTTGNNNKKGANKNRRKESQVKQGPGVLPAANTGASSNSSSSIPSSAAPASSPASGTPAAGQTVSILSRSNKRSQRSSNNVGLPEVNSSLPTASSVPVAAEASGTDQLALSRLLTELQGMRNDMKAMEANTALRMEQTLQRQMEAQFARLEKKNEERDKQARDRQQRLFAAISQNINATVTQTVEKAVQKEVQNLVIPTLQRSLRSMETSLNKTVHEGILKPLLTELEPKLSAVATSLTDNLAQALSKRDQEGVSSSTNAVQLAQVPSALSLAATNQLAASLQQPVQEAFSSYFKDILVPAFENSCRAMFVQIDASIKNGLKESFRSLEARGAPSAAGGTGGSGSGIELTAEYGLMMQQMRTAVQTLVDISSGLNRSIVETQNQLLLHYASSMEALQQQAAGMLPRQGGVAQAEKKEDVTTTLNRLLNQSRYEEAFNLVLSQSNVDLLTWLCSQVDPQTVFAKTPAMDQLVLLSLLQQLGFALDQDSQLKLRWLTEIALQVDPTNPTTTTLASPILNTLLQNLEQVLLPQLSASRDRTTMHSFKVLTHIVNSLLQECDKETSSSAASLSAPNTISSSAAALPSSAASSSAPPTSAKHQTSSSSTKAKSKRP